MTAADQQLLQDTKKYVTDYFTTRIGPDFIFHNFEHTQEVVKAAELIADYSQVPDDNRLPLLLACWFHDTGYSGGFAKDHEELSKNIAARFLAGRVDAGVIEKVKGCILATKWPQTPTSLIEQIICDADLYHLGTEECIDKAKLLRKELNLLQDKKISKKEWRQMNIAFMQQHHYFTAYGRSILDPGKQNYLEQLLSGDDHKEEKPEKEKKNMASKPVESAGISDTQADKLRREKQNRIERSISTMFRIMTNNHVNLSHMADSKANIMISVNTIVISIIVSVLTGKLQFYPEYIAPTIILLCACLAAIVFAILATRPTITRGTFTKEDIQNKKINLLFFGNFYNMSLPDYDWAMKEMMSDHDYLNSSMIKDIYFLGLVLARKYKFLRLSYNLFMYGLIVAILGFGISFIIGGGASAG